MIDETKITQSVRAIIEAIGDDPDREGLKDTPVRVSKMYREFFSGISEEAGKALETVFDENHKEIVVFKDLAFFSICEHHFLPFYGVAHIGYLPEGKVVGASKVARALDILARRPQIQERLTDRIVDAIDDTLKPGGVAVMISAEHMCMSLRGVKKPGSKIVTFSSRGKLKTQQDCRRDFFRLLGDV